MKKTIKAKNVTVWWHGKPITGMTQIDFKPFEVGGLQPPQTYSVQGTWEPFEVFEGPQPDPMRNLDPQVRRHLVRLLAAPARTRPGESWVVRGVNNPEVRKAFGIAWVASGVVLQQPEAREGIMYLLRNHRLALAHFKSLSFGS